MRDRTLSTPHTDKGDINRQSWKYITTKVDNIEILTMYLVEI